MHTNDGYNFASKLWFNFVIIIIAQAGIILCMHPANEIWLYSVTPSLIGWAHTQSDSCTSIKIVLKKNVLSNL